MTATIKKTKDEAKDVKVEKKSVSEVNKKTTPKKKDVYYEGVGRRKTAIARVRIIKEKTKGGHDKITINGNAVNKYFKLKKNQNIVMDALEKSSLVGEFSVSIKVVGGGVSAQAGAIRHGMARALVKCIPDIKKKIKVFGYLTRDSRMVERKKPGLKKARKAPQWTKR